MALVIFQRAPAWLAVGALILSVAALPSRITCAQAPPTQAPPTAAAPTQPAWVGQTPMYQVGPNGAVNLDQPMTAPPDNYVGQGYPMQSFMQPPPNPGAPQYAQPSPAGQPWGTQAVQPQPAWGAPLLSGSTLTGGPIPPVFVHRHSVFGEFLYMRPRNAEIAYALPIVGPVPPMLGNEVPAGRTAVVDPDYDIAFRAGFNIALDQGSSFAVQYTRLRSETDSSATVAAPIVLRSLVSHPLGANAATDALDASASQDIDLDRLDFDFRSLLFGCECASSYAINYIVGAEYGSLDQRFDSSFVSMDTTTVGTRVDFDGLGMRLGLQGERFWPHSGAFVYGVGVSNFLFGDFDAVYTQSDSVNGVEATTSWTAGRIVPVLDFEVGAGWLVLNRRLRLSAGYRISSWFNVVKTDDWINAVQSNEFTNLDGTLTFDGLVGRAEWQF